MDWMGETAPNDAPIRRRCGRKSAGPSCSAELRPGCDPLEHFAARPRHDLRLCAGRRLSRRHQEAPEGARAMAGAQAGGDVKVFVDTAPVMEKPLAQPRASAGKASTPISSRANTARGCFSARSSRRSICRATQRERPLRHLQRLPRHLPDRRPSPRPTSSMRAAAFPTSPSNTKARSRASSARPSATASTAATIASPSARGTNSRSDAAKRIVPATNWRPRCSPTSATRRHSLPRAFTNHPIKRIGRDRFVRNVLIAIGNPEDTTPAPQVDRRTTTRPLVRGAAVWALSQLMTPDAFTALAVKAMGREADESVRTEWRRNALSRHAPRRRGIQYYPGTSRIIRTCPGGTGSPAFAGR